MHHKFKHTITSFIRELKKTTKTHKYFLRYGNSIRSETAANAGVTCPCPLEIVFPELGWQGVKYSDLMSSEDAEAIQHASDAGTDPKLRKLRKRLLNAVKLKEPNAH